VASEEDLNSFISSSFRSVWALELLCHLRRNPEKELTAGELVEQLRASDSVVRGNIAQLVAAGLVAVTSEGAARYAPVNKELDRLAGEAEAQYARSPDAVRRVIVRASHPGLTAFSDAFRLGGDK
jgi:DNA-binding GntR family transcriptional regulator